MRHRVKGSKLGRTASHRSATLRSLATALIKHKKITTTLAKAKQTRVFVEPIITKAKNDSVHSRRLISRNIQDRAVLKELFSVIVPKIGDRPGGYTRIVKLGNRVGDAAEMAIIELVDYNEVANTKTKKTKKQVKAEKSVTSKTPKAVKEVVETEAEVVDVNVADDLTKIEGIGPKISELLVKSGIDTYAKLSETEVDKISAILSEAGGSFKSHDPNSWPQQAKLAAENKWDELKTLQDELDGGREKK